MRTRPLFRFLSGLSRSLPVGGAPRPALPLRALLGALAAVALATPAAGESALRLPFPEEMGAVDVDTYDEAGVERIGPGYISFKTLDDGTVSFVGSSGIDGAENTVVKALFEPTADGYLRPLYQESRSHDAAGKPLGVMTIDHRKGTGTCAPTDREARTVPLPDEDRVANVILAQALVPLAAAGQGERPFQILLCRPTVRVVSARAFVRKEKGWSEGNLVEIETGADLGPVLNRLLAPFLPSVSLWFERDHPAWLGHRVPLFAKGPTVTVMRADIAAKLSPEVVEVP